MLLSSDDTSEASENHEINVTPFIDVVLVLLIIFMVVAPLSTVTMEVSLPSVSAEPREQSKPPLIVTLREDNSLMLNENELTAGIRLSSALASPQYVDKKATVLIRASKDVSYENLIAVMDELRQAGFLNISLEALSMLGKPSN